MTDPLNLISGLHPTRAAVIVDGQDQPGLAAGLLKYLIVENTRGLRHCEITVGNWGATADGIGYLYFDRRIVDLGKRLEVRLGAATLFDGRITALEAQFPTDTPPALAIRAEGNIPRPDLAIRPGGPALNLAYKVSLRECSVIAEQSGRVIGHGVTDTDSGLGAGALINLAGLGSRFSGVYRVTEVKHTFGDGGYRSEFTARQSAS